MESLLPVRSHSPPHAVLPYRAGLHEPLQYSHLCTDQSLCLEFSFTADAPILPPLPWALLRYPLSVRWSLAGLSVPSSPYPALSSSQLLKSPDFLCSYLFAFDSPPLGE